MRLKDFKLTNLFVIYWQLIDLQLDALENKKWLHYLKDSRNILINTFFCRKTPLKRGNLCMQRKSSAQYFASMVAL